MWKKSLKGFLHSHIIFTKGLFQENKTILLWHHSKNPLWHLFKSIQLCSLTKGTKDTPLRVPPSDSVCTLKGIIFLTVYCSMYAVLLHTLFTFYSDVLFCFTVLGRIHTAIYQFAFVVISYPSLSFSLAILHCQPSV